MMRINKLREGNRGDIDEKNGNEILIVHLQQVKSCSE